MGAKKKKISSFLNQAQEKIKARSFAASAHIPLRLKAINGDDLDIMAVLMQDAIISHPNSYYDKEQGTFTLKSNRFCWETRHYRFNHQKVYQRVLTCLQFQEITHVQHLNFKKESASAYYNLLTMTAIQIPSHWTDKNNMVQATENKDKKYSYTIDLIFSHDARIRLHATEIKAILLDSEETSYTNKKPAHTTKDVGRYIIANAIREYKNQKEV